MQRVAMLVTMLLVLCLQVLGGYAEEKAVSSSSPHLRHAPSTCTAPPTPLSPRLTVRIGSLLQRAASGLRAGVAAHATGVALFVPCGAMPLTGLRA
eukprot:COSAG02_NODE_2206_length_9517_cov_3.928860_8_plen_96_part_00